MPQSGYDERLFTRWRTNHDERARDELIMKFLPLARKLALRYALGREPVDDLVQVATVGLIGALNRYDPGLGKPFTALAIPTILGELKRHFRDHCWAMHVPRPEQELALKVRGGHRELTAQLGRAPTLEQLAEWLELSLEDVGAGVQVNQANARLSLDAPVGEDPAGATVTLGDTVGALDDGYALVETTASLHAAIRRLGERDRGLLTLRFREQLTQREIAERIGVSQMQVSRLLRAALGRLDTVAGVATA